MVDWPREPPEKRETQSARRPAAVPSVACRWKYSVSSVWSTPGMGIQKPMR